MKNISDNKGWNSGMTQSHVGTSLIPLIKGTYGGKSDKDFVKLELRRYPMSSTSDLYEFRMCLFDNFNLEEFLLFMNNFNINIVAIGALETGVRIQYRCKIVRGEALRQFGLFSNDV